MGKGRLHIGRNFGLFWGALPQNARHRHYALQICAAPKAEIGLVLDEGPVIWSQMQLVGSQIWHALQVSGEHLTLLVDPLSPTGHLLHLQLQGQPNAAVPVPLAEELNSGLERFVDGRLSFEELVAEVSLALTNFRCDCGMEAHVADQRVLDALAFMEIHHDEVLSLARVADHVCLSSARFLHLFKAQTGISFRRYQLWNKARKSLEALQASSVSETAHASGFADSAHFARTIKETFGINPKFLKMEE